MSNTGGGGGPGFFGRIGNAIGVGRQPNFNVQGVVTATTQINDLNTAVTNLTTNLSGINSNLGNTLTGILNQIRTTAQSAATALNSVGSAGGGGGGGGSGSGTPIPSSASPTTGGRGMFGTAIGGLMNVAGSDILKDLAMFPLRFIEQTVGANRQLGMNISTGLASEMYATGGTEGFYARTLSRFPGNVRGSPEDLINLVSIARQAGAFLDINQAGVGGQQGSARTTGFLQAVSQAQAMTPGTPVSQIAGTIGGFGANVGAQQQAAFMTGGAFAMIGAGGRHKSISEWAEDILHWFEQLRGGEQKGKQFSYGELMSQYFPGSNIDVWFNVNGVPEGMREYWWNYALAKARTGGAQGREMLITPVQTGVGGAGNQAWQRLESVSAKARGDLRLASALTGTYSNKEQANRWFNDLMGQITNEVIPAQMGQGALSALQYLPDAMEELMLGFLERSGPIGALLGGGIGYGISGGTSLIKNLMSMFTTGIGGAAGYLQENSLMNILGNLGGQFKEGGGISDFIEKAMAGLTGDAPASSDIGDMEFGNMGTRSLAGLHPDMRKKLGRMMRANPALSITSGMRDTWQQMQLKSQGHTRVSGGPSAHTRGQAADLGPPSQYPWIMANARKFGLKSGRNVGEPWHVGMGDVETPWGIGIGDDFPPNPLPGATFKSADGRVWTYITGIGWNDGSTSVPLNTNGTASVPLGTPTAPSPPTTGTATGSPQTYIPSIITGSGGVGSMADQAGLGRLFSLFTGGFGRENVIETIGSIVPSLMTLFLGLFGMGGQTPEGARALQYSPEVYDLFMKSRQFNIGGIQGAPTGVFGSLTLGPSSSSTSSTNPNTNTTSGEARSLLEALQIVEKPARTPSPTTLSPGGLVARLAFAAGFRGDDLATVVGISSRESGWNPDAHNPVGVDNSYGLMQINMKDDVASNPGMGRRRLEAFRAAGIEMDSYDDLKDPFINLQAAYQVSSQGSNWDPWVYHGDPMSGWKVTRSQAQNLVRAAGLGDAEMALMSASMLHDGPQMPPLARVSGGTNGTAPVFNNTFLIQGGGDSRTGGIDVRRTVSILADHLEVEMKKRVSRRN